MRSNLILGITIALMLFFSCERSVTIRSNPSRIIASERFLQIQENDKMPKGLRNYLKNVQQFKKFSIAYFLIPMDDVYIAQKEAITESIMNQITMSISGKKHYRYFISSKSKKEYELLLGTYRLVEAEESEFYAINSEQEKYIVWTKDNEKREPFVVLKNKSEDKDIFKIINKDQKQINFMQSYKNL